MVFYGLTKDGEMSWTFPHALRKCGVLLSDIWRNRKQRSEFSADKRRWKLKTIRPENSRLHPSRWFAQYSLSLWLDSKSRNSLNCLYTVLRLCDNIDIPCRRPCSWRGLRCQLSLSFKETTNIHIEIYCAIPLCNPHVQSHCAIPLCNPSVQSHCAIL